MAITAAQLSVNVTANTAEAEAGLNRISEQSSGASGALGRMWETASGMIVAQLAMQAMSFVSNQIKDVFTQANTLQSVLTQTNTVLNSTHDAAGMSATAINSLATQLSQVTPYSRTAVQSAENLLLTFTTVGKDTFPTATQAILDMSTAMGQDWKSSTIMIGKALDDPVKGLTALTRVGVTFDAQQKAQIKTLQASGNMAGAQAIILKELEREFGNSAKAAGTTFSGQLQILNNSFDNVKAKIGMEIMPVLVELVKKLAPIAMQLGNALPGALAAVGAAFMSLAPLGAVIGDAFQYISNQMTALTPTLGDVSNAFEQLRGPVVTIGAELVQGFEQVGQVIFGVVLPAVIPLVQHAIRLGVAIASAVLPVIARVLPILQNLGNEIMATLVPAIARIINSVMTNLVPALIHLWNEIAPKLIPVIQFLATIIRNVLLPALGFIGNIIGTVVIPIIGAIITVIANVLGWLLTFVDGFLNMGKGVGNVVTGIGNFFRNTWDMIVKGVSNFFSLIQSAIQMGINFVKGIFQDGINFVVGLFDWLYNHNYYFKNLVDSIKNAITIGMNWLKNTWKTISDDVVTAWNIIKSFIETTINNVKKTITTVITTIQIILKGVWTTISTDASTAWTAFTNAISNVLTPITNAVGNIVSAITGAIGNLATVAITWGENLITGFISGITNKLGAVKNVAGNVVGSIANFFGFHSPAKEGPGSEADTWAPNLMSMFTDGITKSVPGLTTAARAAMTELQRAFGPNALGGGLQSTINSTVTHLAGPIPNALAASTMGANAAANAMSNQTIVLELDGKRVGQVLMPVMFGNNGLVRQSVGVRNF